MYFSGSTLHLRIWTDFVICRLEPAWLDLVQIFMSDEGDCNKLNTAASFFELLSCEFRGLLLVFIGTLLKMMSFEREEVELWDRCNDWSGCLFTTGSRPLKNLVSLETLYTSNIWKFPLRPASTVQWGIDPSILWFFLYVGSTLTQPGWVSFTDFCPYGMGVSIGFIGVNWNILGNLLPTQTRARMEREDPPNLSILLSGGKETNKDSPSNGEWSGNSSKLKSSAPTGTRVVI